MSEEIIYECLRCGARMTEADLKFRGEDLIKCVNCSYKVLRKVRPPIAHRVKAI